MAKLYNLARMTTATAGTGTITLGSAVSGYLTFALAGAANGDVVSYGIKDGANSEVGTGTYTSSGTTLTRTVTKSTNANAAISLSGSAEVFITPRAEDLITAGLMPGFLFGLTLSTAGSSSTFGIAAGVATDSTNISMLALGSAYTKTTSAWAVGSTNGAMDTGSVAGGTWYHVYLIKRPDTGVVDVLLSLSATSPTLPANYTLFRRIGSMKTNGAAQWATFSQSGDEFLWDAGALAMDISTGALDTTSTLFTVKVPTGIKVGAILQGYISAAAVRVVMITSPDQGSGSVVSGFAVAANARSGVSATVRTNTSAQIRAVSDGASTSFVAGAMGWIDRRGRDG